MMNDDQTKGMWKQIKGKVKAAFGRLNDDDLTEVEGNTEAMVGRLQERYGYTREQAENEWNKFMRDNGGQDYDTRAHGEAAKRHGEQAVDQAKKGLEDALD